MNEKAKSKEQAKEWCRRFVELVRRHLWVDPDSGQPQAESSGLRLHFSHESYKRLTRPDGLNDELDRITAILGSFGVAGTDASVSCECPLVGGKIMFSD